MFKACCKEEVSAQEQYDAIVGEIKTATEKGNLYVELNKSFFEPTVITPFVKAGFDVVYSFGNISTLVSWQMAEVGRKGEVSKKWWNDCDVKDFLPCNTLTAIEARLYSAQNQYTILNKLINSQEWFGESLKLSPFYILPEVAYKLESKSVIILNDLNNMPKLSKSYIKYSYSKGSYIDMTHFMNKT